MTIGGTGADSGTKVAIAVVTIAATIAAKPRS